MVGFLPGQGSFVTPIFRSVDFRRLWCNAVLNAISMGGDLVLVGWMIHGATGGSDWVGIGFGLFFFPMLLFGVPSGSVADRFDRGWLLRHAELAAAVVLAAFACIPAVGGEGLVFALVASFVLGSVRAVHNPIRLSLAYDLVGPAYAISALAAINLGVRLGQGAGALMVGYLAHDHGIVWGFMLMAVAHVLAYAALGTAMSVVSAQHPERPGLGQHLSESIAEMRRNRVLLILIVVTAIIEIFGTSFSTLLPELARLRLNLGIDGLGEFQAASAVGAFTAAALLTAWPVRGRRAYLYGIVIVALGAAVMLLGWAPDQMAVLIVLAAVAFAIAAWDILTQSMMQLSVPDRLRGRAMGAWVFALGSAPLGHLQIGFLAASIGLDLALYANGMLVVATISIALLLSRSLRRL